VVKNKIKRLLWEGEIVKYMVSISEKFSEGVWYDEMLKEYYSISVEEDEVVLNSPDDGSESHRVAAYEFRQDDFRQVPERAVQDPAGYLEVKLNDLMSDREHLETPNTDIGVQYAFQNVELVEK
jgi:hypothetical protein